jgi:3-dehydroquinate dehydratase-2
MYSSTILAWLFLSISIYFSIFAETKVVKIFVNMKIQIINGPNLNMLGVREPGIYGSSSFDTYLMKLRDMYPDVEIEYYQSNIEGELIDRMQKTGFDSDGIVLNAGAYTHTSIALQDCIRSLKCPVVEVHISNVHKREEFRHHSFISCVCRGVICGFGLDSYRLAIESLLVAE